MDITFSLTLVRIYTKISLDFSFIIESIKQATRKNKF